MISTVTTTTVSTVTTVTLAGSLAFVGIVVLLAMLIQKELTVATSSNQFKRWSVALNIAIVPLVIAFVLTVAAKVFDILR